MTVNSQRTSRNQPPVCPLTTGPCRGELCAWYRGPLDGCAMTALADALEALVDALRDIERGSGAGPGEAP